MMLLLLISCYCYCYCYWYHTRLLMFSVMMWLQFKLSSGAWGLELPDEWMFPAETLGASSYLGTIMSDGHHGWLLLDFYLFHFGFAEFLIFMCKKWAVRGKCRTKFSQFRQFEFAQQICTQTRLLKIIICIHGLIHFINALFLRSYFWRQSN